jgi:hypothetical protein
MVHENPLVDIGSYSCLSCPLDLYFNKCSKFMKNLLICFVTCFLVCSNVKSQYGSIELNTGGFSFIPLFTSDKPHFILRAGTNDKKRLSLNLINLIMMDGFHPANYSLITRYKLIDKRLKINLGFQLPGYRLFENEEFKARSVQEVRASISLNPKTDFLFLYLHGEGKNFEMNNNFYSVYFRKTFNKLVANSQFYILFTSLEPDSSYGIAQNISYKLKDKISLNFFINKSLTNEVFNKTFGIQFYF